MEVELSLTKDKLAQSELYIELVAKYAHELKKYMLKNKTHRFNEILALRIKDTKN
jgi:hypothetical protein